MPRGAEPDVVQECARYTSIRLHRQDCPNNLLPNLACCLVGLTKSGLESLLTFSLRQSDTLA